MAWTISRRIAVGFSVILVMFVVLVVVAVLALRNTVGTYESAQAQEQQRLLPAFEAESAAREAALHYERFLLTEDRSFLASSDSAAAEARGLLERLRSSAPTPERRERWARALDLLGRWEDGVRASAEAWDAGDRDEAIAIYQARTLPARFALRDEIDTQVAQIRSRTDDSMSEAGAAARRMEWLILLASALTLVIGVASALLLNRAVTAPLRETTTVLASSAAEILAVSTQQASSASQTSAAVVETSATVDEVAQTSEQAAERARGVADSAQRAARIGESGRRAVDESAGAMTAVKEQVESIADNIVTLAEQAQSIGEIIASVDDLSDQTNLLALNAAVEAARAGEHGRGFSVVAGEIRNLADQSKKATVQVRRILGEIQRATSAAVMNSERGTQQVAAAAQQVDEAGETIRALAEAVGDAAQSSSQIVASAGQQAVGMSQIRQAMGSIQDATQQNLASSRQAEAAARDLDRLGRRLLGLVGGDRQGAALREGGA